MTVLETLIKQFSKLPGIGKKSASRIVYFLLNKDKIFLEKIAEQIVLLKEKTLQCPVCGNYTEVVPCSICSDPRRDRSTICVVEQSQDISIIESTREYSGLYHVLMGLISPINGIGPEKLLVGQLINRVKKGNVKELIIATNPSVEGDTTALYISKVLKELEIKISRLASGIPVGGDLEYAGRLTLARSLKGRIPL